MTSILDDEYVLEMDEAPPFSWLSKSHERLMNCNLNRNKKIIVHARANSYTYSLIAMESKKMDMEVDEFFTNRNEGEHIIISISGDEENSINFLKSMEKECIVVSTGGQIKKVAREKKFEFISLPKGMPSRFMFPEIIGCLAGGLETEDINKLGDEISKLNPSSLTEENKAKTIAISMFTKLPLIIFSGGYFGLARKFQEDLIQNSSILAPVLSVSQYEMLDSLDENYIIIEISETKKVKVKNSLFLKTNRTVKDVIYFSVMESFITLYLSLLHKKDFYLFDRLKE